MSTFIPCINSITLKQASLEEKIRLSAQNGYKAIELWNDELTQYVEGGGSLDDVMNRVHDADLHVPNIIAVHGWINATGADRDKAFEEVERRMDQAAKVGSPFITASPSKDEIDVDLAAENYRALLDLGEQHGVRPALEYLGFVKGLKDIKTAAEIIEKADHPDSTIVHDFFHMYNGGSSVEDLRLIPADKIAMVHLDDAPDTKAIGEYKDADRVWPGDGTIQLRQMCDVLKEIGYTGYVSLELFNPEYWEMDAEEAARVGAEKSRPYFSA
ncbi:MAG: sugar phosphate isomerase/epimerase [Armatimonadetes bacterium]|nr:sugar phosphate isomerase/epimerase [Armatimonadota bacterium]